ncbi:hypothetical protein [Saccharothrix coeruleofusca]|uniref:PPE family protein n=1 Tax=Saccharothrix coeruleofusca TaxID=33919 RepID=A0A918ATA4_9PSEU|nr:hypothetical protein [Saccharothrix coeruleofusca]GGP73155.1 hypothetical protein GCM10010185_53290 [Saccharothrix coeruleofusca]
MTYERPVAPTPTANYPAHEHAEMQRQVNEKFDPAVAGQIADEWKAIGATFTELAVDFTVIVNGSQAGWTGSAAEGARAALAKVGEFSDTTGDHFTATGAALQAQTDVAAEAKARMPEPVEFDPGRMFLEGMGGGIVGIAALPVTMPLRWAQSESAKAQAVQVMRDRDEGMRAAVGSMPGFTEIPVVTQDQGVATSSTQTSSVSTATINDRVGPTGVADSARDSARDADGARDTTRASWTPPPAVTPPPPGTPPPGTPPTAPPTPGPSTLPQGWVPGPSGGGRPPADGRLVPGPGPVPGPGSVPPGSRPLPPGARQGSGPGGGSAGRGAGGAGAAGAGRGGVPGGLPGGAKGGVPGTSSGVAPGRGPSTGFGPTGAGQPGGGAAAGQAAARGGAPVAGAGVGAGQGQGEEDQEHKAKYLIPTDEYFDDDRLVAPPTIGGE